MAKTITLADLKPGTVSVHAAGMDHEFSALRIQDFIEIVRSNPGLSYAFVVPAERRAAALVKGIMDAGADAINEILNRSAIIWDFDAADAPFSIAEELRMVKAIIEHSLPREELEKLWAELKERLSGLGLQLEAETPETE